MLEEDSPGSEEAHKIMVAAPPAADVGSGPTASWAETGAAARDTALWATEEPAVEYSAVAALGQTTAPAEPQRPGFWAEDCWAAPGDCWAAALVAWAEEGHIPTFKKAQRFY